ncbi:MAG: hypothetical protein E2O77_01290 [Caldithrix sp.]|nr:MAG: hypothetical protein E2O77_01290 [Caldithrix sp.]
MKDGASLEQFLEWFPGVKRSRIEAVLDFESNDIGGFRQQMKIYLIRVRLCLFAGISRVI